MASCELQASENVKLRNTFIELYIYTAVFKLKS